MHECVALSLPHTHLLEWYAMLLTAVVYRCPERLPLPGWKTPAYTRCKLSNTSRVDRHVSTIYCDDLSICKVSRTSSQIERGTDDLALSSCPLRGCDLDTLPNSFHHLLGHLSSGCNERHLATPDPWGDGIDPDGDIPQREFGRHHLRKVICCCLGRIVTELKGKSDTLEKHQTTKTDVILT